MNCRITDMIHCLVPNFITTCFHSDESKFEVESISDKSVKKFSKGRRFVDDEVGDVSEFYALGKTLRKDAFGCYCEAENRITGEKVLCRVVVKKRLFLKADVAGIRRELEVLRRLSGAAEFASLKSLHEDNSYLYIMTESRVGGDLFEEICTYGSLTEPQAAKIFNEMLKVVQKLHSHEILHRNLTPQSFVFAQNDPHSKVKLANFEAAVFLSPGELLSEVAGNPFYVAPEVLKKKYSFKSDIWSLGVILYAILCGNLPFLGENSHELNLAILDGKFNFEGQIWENISDQAKDLIKNLLAVHPHERLSLEDALSHPWIRTGGTHPGQPNPKIILNSLSREHIKILGKVFKVMDTDKDGKVTYLEFKAGLSIFRTQLPEEQFLIISDAVLWNPQAEFNYEEFISNSSYVYVAQKADSLLKSMEQYVTDDGGSLSLASLAEVLEKDGELNSQEIQSILFGVDLNKDGEISLSELEATFKAYSS